MWRYVTIPILVNVAVAAVAYTVLLVAGFRAVDAAVAGLSGAAAAFGPVLKVLLVGAALVAVAFVVVRFGVVLGSPWYGRLSEELELLLTGSAPPAERLTPAGITRDLGRAVRFELQKLLLVAAVGLPLLVANVLPGFGQAVAGTGGLALAATVACLDFFDGPLERRRWSFRRKLAYARRRLPASAGFGVTCALLLGVPVVNLLSIPLCVVAGTLFFCEAGPRRRPAEVNAGPTPQAPG